MHIFYSFLIEIHNDTKIHALLLQKQKGPKSSFYHKWSLENIILSHLRYIHDACREKKNIIFSTGNPNVYIMLGFVQ